MQLVHDTDADSLFLLMIKDFKTFEIQEIDFSNENGHDLQFLIERYSFGTNNLINNITSIF